MTLVATLVATKEGATNFFAFDPTNFFAFDPTNFFAFDPTTFFAFDPTTFFAFDPTNFFAALDALLVVFVIRRDRNSCVDTQSERSSHKKRRCADHEHLIPSPTFDHPC